RVGRTADVLEAFTRLGRQRVGEQPAVRKPLRVLDTFFVLPLMHDATRRIQEVGVLAAYGAEQRVRVGCLFFVSIHEAKRPVPNPRHAPAISVSVVTVRQLRVVATTFSFFSKKELLILVVP